MSGAPGALRSAVQALWQIRPPGPQNLLAAPAFIHLCDTCLNLYPNAGRKDRLVLPLSNAVRALGMPCGLTPASAHLSISADAAADGLDVAFRQTNGKRLYLSPLDMADRLLPPLKFGPNSVRAYDAAQLDALVDGSRLARINPNRTFDARLLSQFHWLVVEQPFRVNERVSHRAYSILDEMISRDWGHIGLNPSQSIAGESTQSSHGGKQHREQRGFYRPCEALTVRFVPWVYQTDDDIFERPPPPPDPDTFSWEPNLVYDPQTEEWIELDERPIRYSFRPEVEQATEWLNDDTWGRLVEARRSPLFETPTRIFFVRAVCAEGVDEFLAHITTIEAALGLQSDFPGATRHMVKRVTTLLGSSTDGDDYRHLFDLRSCYLHGRPMNEILGKDRSLARRLARRVVDGIVGAALKIPKTQSREEFLKTLG